MSGVILVSSHDLDAAGAIRQAFQSDGFNVELVTPGEDLSERMDADLLVITGEVGTENAREMIRQVREAGGAPVFGLFGPDTAGEKLALTRELELTESFNRPVDPGDVLLLGGRAIKRRRLQEVTGIVGETEPIREALERVVQIAPVHATVLITGESGTGKELVARGIHALSPRKGRPFIAVNVAALSDTLLESELFGHEKGAFTGAIDSRKGMFELADRGTIFLDEIGEMPLPTQTKLLRVLEQREFLRVGGEETRHVDVRIIAATNQPLRQLVSTGDFRRDLYYRLNVLSIELPPLRERREDVPRLVHEFVRDAVERHDRPFPGISDEAMEILMDYSWPGNVRELRNLVESMVVLAPGRKIEPRDIPPEIRSPGSSRSLLPALAPRRLPRPERSEDADAESPGVPGVRPEIVEFIFRTLVELRVDLDDLRKDFEIYKERLEDQDVSLPAEAVRELEVQLRQGGAPEGDAGSPAATEEAGTVEVASAPAPGEEPGDGDQLDAEPGLDGEPPKGEGERAVVFRPGMTMEDMEREAIAAALREVEGNRRKAAELLGIGERTLYRKLRKFDIGE